jgi:hypothetical protein
MRSVDQDWRRQYSVSEIEIENAHMRGRVLCQAEIDRFASAGVSASALFTPSALRVQQVVFRTDEIFDFVPDAPDEESVALITILVLGVGGTIDIVSWDPRTDRLGLWLGRAFALGETELWAPRLGREVVSIWRSPWGWLRSGRQGVVILRPHAAPFYFDHVPEVLAEDLEHGEELEKILRPSRPRTKILLPSQTTQRSRSAVA